NYVKTRGVFELFPNGEYILNEIYDTNIINEKNALKLCKDAINSPNPTEFINNIDNTFVPELVYSLWDKQKELIDEQFKQKLTVLGLNNELTIEDITGVVDGHSHTPAEPLPLEMNLVLTYKEIDME